MEKRFRRHFRHVLSARGEPGSRNAWLPPLSVATLGSECSLIVAWFSAELAHAAGTSPSFARAFTALVASAGIVISLLLAWVVRTHIQGRVRAADISQEMTRALRASEAANVAKSQFLANMSHEIRTPLTAILGYAEVLRTEPGNISPADRLDYAGTIHRAAEHLLTVINDILDLSKIEAGGMQIESVDVPLRTQLLDIERLMQPRAREKGVCFSLHLDEALPDHAVTDPTRLSQIILNLVGNAIKFTPQGSVILRVGVAGSGTSRQLHFDVEDTGIGISAPEAERLFAAFVQADASVTRKHGGTGLGLSISRRLARLMGGEVALVRSIPGKGSTFRLSLPLRCAGSPNAVLDDSRISTVKVQPPPRSTHSPLRGRILLAEDGVDNQRLISHHLRKAGAEVDIACDGRVALEMLERADDAGQPYDLLLSDMQMPNMDGYTLAKTLRARGNGIAIVALTAHALADDRSRCLSAGCDDYESKPINKEHLVSLCAKWMGRGRPAEAA